MMKLSIFFVTIIAGIFIYMNLLKGKDMIEYGMNPALPCNADSIGEEAITAFHDLNGKRLIPMHYGTFDLSDEPMGEPIKRLKMSALEKNYMENIKEFAISQTFIIE